MISVKRLIQIQVEISFIKDQEVSHIVKKRIIFGLILLVLLQKEVREIERQGRKIR